jgi:hypothetical protein
LYFRYACEDRFSQSSSKKNLQRDKEAEREFLEAKKRELIEQNEVTFYL